MDAYDVVVVGAGPAGAVAARAAAEGGARVLLVDHRPELGQPVQCGEFLPTAEELVDVFGAPELIARAYTIPPATVLRETRYMECVAPTGRRYRFALGGATVSRRAFDKALAFAAEGAGAELQYPLGVSGVRGDRVRFARGGEVVAKAIVAADGPTSTVGTSVCFRPRRVMYRMITATTDGDLGDTIELYFGRDAPRGYAWRFPRANDLNVGLGVPRLAPGTSLRGLLDRFLGRLDAGRATLATMWWVPIGPPPPTLTVGRVAFAGDAANLVMATNGGGIPTAMLSGRLAGEAAAAHATLGRPLADYDRAIDGSIRPALARGAAIYRWGDRLAPSAPLLAGAMRFIGSRGLDRMMRLRWPRPGGAS